MGGFATQYAGWRWANWVVVIAAGVALVCLVFVPETYAPALLQSRTKELRKERNDDRFWSQYDVKVGFLKLMKVNLSRPFVMAITEPICIFWNLYIAIVYGWCCPLPKMEYAADLSQAFSICHMWLIQLSSVRCVAGLSPCLVCLSSALG